MRLRCGEVGGGEEHLGAEDVLFEEVDFTTMSYLLANLTHPIIFQVLPMWSAPIIGGGLIMEAIVARTKFHLNWRATVIAIIVVNLATALLALPMLFVGFEVLYPLEESLGLKLQSGWRDYSSMPTFVVVYALTTLINIAIEVALLRSIWKVPLSLHTFLWWGAANALSNGIVFLALMALMLSR